MERERVTGKEAISGNFVVRITRMSQGQVCVLGLGYIGLPTAVVLAHSGFCVRGVDIDLGVLSTLASGRAHIAEPDLDALLGRVLGDGSLQVGGEVAAADVHFICVPTPFREVGGERVADVSAVLAAARSVASVLRTGDLVVVESTCPVGTTERVEGVLQELRPEVEVLVAYCPERVLPGWILRELVQNDRIVGGTTEEATVAAAAVFERFVEGRVVRTDARTAEMVKLMENTFRDVNIALANEFSLMAHEAGVDVREAIGLANLHPRVNILSPGCGVGGHCIAVDPWFLAGAFPGSSRLVRAAREVNDGKPGWVVERILERLGEGQGVVCLGLAFKADVDDFRESPALAVYEGLRSAGARVRAVEPFAAGASGIWEGVELLGLDEALGSGDLLAGLVPHAEFRRVEDWGGRLLDFCGLGGGTGIVCVARVPSSGRTAAGV